jgi:hypothetical protein
MPELQFGVCQQNIRKIVVEFGQARRRFKNRLQTRIKTNKNADVKKYCRTL